MTGYIIFTIILLIALVVSTLLKSEYDKWESYKKATPLLLVFWLYYLIQYLKLVVGVELTGLWFNLASLIQNLLIPTGYIFVCRQYHIKVMTGTTIGLFMTMLIDFTVCGTVFLDNLAVANPSTEGGIHFYCNHKEAFSLEPHQLVEIIQAIWVLIRSRLLIEYKQQRGLVATRNSLLIIALVIMIVTALITSSFVPDVVWLSKLWVRVYFAVHLALACLCLIALGLGYTEKLLVDDNEEIAYIDTVPKYAEMRKKMERIMEEEKLYTDNNLGVEMMAQRLGTNRTYIAQMMKEEFGTTFVNYVNRLRVDEAKRLIRSNKLEKLEEVAVASGFASASTFTKTFKALTGVTPHMWRG